MKYVYDTYMFIGIDDVSYYSMGYVSYYSIITRSSHNFGGVFFVNILRDWVRFVFFVLSLLQYCDKWRKFASGEGGGRGGGQIL